jgi:hypothetical protein
MKNNYYINIVLNDEKLIVFLSHSSWLFALTDGTGADNFNACIQWQQWQAYTNQSELESMNWQIQFTQLQYNLGPAYTGTNYLLLFYI